MNSIIVSQVLLLGAMAFASNSLLSLAAVGGLESSGKEVKEMRLSSTTCPQTCTDKDGKHCCSK
ncbi:hypothetical protein BCD67_15180 [Oscillatoriales cyanobacterium USR001]|nr:hypothetical protein BCD67_15180 [Oscillatoriales cyanobacterium USR001]